MSCLLCLSVFSKRQALSLAGQGGRFVAFSSIKGPYASVGEIIIQHGRNRGKKTGAESVRQNPRLSFDSYPNITAFVLIYI